jgi:2-methylisocitrate lyase-like PEP mutase family enzyme
VKSAARRAGVDLFVNARTDVYLRGLGAEEARVKETLSRARLYRDAGADGLFVPKVVDSAAIRAIASECGLPLNVLAWPALPSAPELRALGVRRLSSGSALSLVAYGRAATAAEAFLREGRSEALTDGSMTYAKMNALFSRA